VSKPNSPAARGPQFLRFIRPILDVLGDIGGAGQASEVTDLVIERLAIPEADLAVANRNGQSKIRNQIAWARMYLVHAGLLDPGQRGVWALTQRAAGLKLKDSDVLALFKRVQEGHRNKREEASAVEVDVPAANEDETLTEVSIVDVRTQLLQVLRKLPAEGFERLCQRLLRVAGFERVTVTGKSGDGGIDGHGLLQVNPFVSFKVLFQCKRYVGSVGSPHVRDFRGALAGRADKGLILTTGTFTADARVEAHRDGVPPIELVDGEKLVEMFEKYELGMKPTVTYELDPEFFVAFGRKAQG